ncbi:hypothetical protein HID58_086277, partial [Brassica napus]
SSFPNPSSPLFSSPSSSSSPWTHLRYALVLVTSSSPATSSSSSNPHRLKSMWSRFKRKKPLTLSRWKRFFTPDGRLHNRGVGLLKKVRSRFQRRERCYKNSEKKSVRETTQEMQKASKTRQLRVQVKQDQ